MTRTDWWAVCETQAFTPRKLILLAELFGEADIQCAQDLIDLLLPHALFRSALTKDKVYEAYERASRLEYSCKEADIEMLAIIEHDYPQRLRNIPDPPVGLFIRGNKELLNTENGIALIGTRKASDYGLEIAYRYGQLLAETGKTVVSGLALGCDSAGHEGCLSVNGGKTIAFLPGSVKNVFPQENRTLAERILDGGGALISEYPPDVTGLIPVHNFIERDRLQSGLSHGIVVVETANKGGSMHTARFAEKQGKRPLACVDSHPPHLSHPQVVGGNWNLIKYKRASPIKSECDLRLWLKELPNAKLTEQLKIYP